MLGIARFAMRGPLQAIGASAAFALLALIFAPALYVSGGIIGLVTLRRGAVAALQVMVAASALCAGAILGLTGHLGLAAMLIVATWLPVWAACLTLRRTESQGTALLNVGVCVAAYAGWVRLALPDVEAFWRERLNLLAEAVKLQGGKFLEHDALNAVSGMMHSASVAVMAVSLGGMVLLARWWQAGLYNVGGFRLEYHALTVPRWLLPVAGGIALFGTVLTAQGNPPGYAGDLLIVLVLLFATQGLAVLHAAVAIRALHGGCLVGTYMLVGLVPHVVVPLLAAIGMADLVGNFRRRLSSL